MIGDGLRLLPVEVGLAGDHDRPRRAWRRLLARQLRLRLPQPRAAAGRAGDGRQGAQERSSRSNSPFAIKPRLDPTLWSWLLHFARRCNDRDMIEAGRRNPAAARIVAGAYQELVERESLDCEFAAARAAVRLPIESTNSSLTPRPTGCWRNRSTARLARSTAMRWSSSSPPSSPAWPAAGTITTTPTSVPTS